MNYIKITSPSNPKIKQALDIKNRRSKYKGEAFIIEGPHLIEMAIASGHRVKEVFFTSEFSSKKDGQKLLRQLAKSVAVIPAPDYDFRGQAPAGIQISPLWKQKTISELDSRSVSSRNDLRGNDRLEIFEITEQILNKLTGTETPQGIIAIASYKAISLEDIAFRAAPLLAIIDGIQEPGNLGTIIRTSDAAGVDAIIILPESCDAFMQKTLRSTSGSIFNIPIIHSELEKLLNWLKSNSIQLAATTLDSDRSIFDSDLKKPIALVFGNEARGVRTEIKKHADLILKIPILGKAESLNVAASAAVCLYETARQRKS